MVSERPADDNSRRYIEYAFGGNDALALAEAKVFAGAFTRSYAAGGRA
jgi:hypothetical protein